jgi:hypothetical protein
MQAEVDRVFSMDAIVAILRAKGMCAYVEQTGGHTATIYASRYCDTYGAPFVLKDANDNPAAEVIAGPGWFEGPGWTNARGGAMYFSFGADDQGESQPTYATESDTAETLAEKMLAFLKGLPDRE